MLDMQNYDPDEKLPSPAPEQFNEILYTLSPIQPILPSNSPNFISFVPTPSGIHPSNHISSSSPPQSTILSDIFPFDGLCNHSNGENDYQFNPILDNLGKSLPTNVYRENISMTNDSSYPMSNRNHSDTDDEKLILLAEPRAYFRARYESEVDRIKNRAQRYIRTEDGTRKYDHPTIKIPMKYRDITRQYYIRVTLVTIKTKKTSIHYIHPYKIDTLENNVLKHEYTNSLFFPINSNDINMGEKSFSISLTKKIQSELKSYGPLRPFDANDDQHIQNIQDPKQIIYEYQLNKSQLIFTVVELHDNNTTVLSYDHTSIETRIMTDNSETNFDSINDRLSSSIKCIPSKGNWQGNEDIVIVMPHSIKKKEYIIWFEYDNDTKQIINNIQHIDTKTILFQTPPCPYLPGNDDIKVSLFIQENQNIPIVIDFYYITPIKTIINLCPNCTQYGMNNSSNKKRAWEYDDSSDIIQQMNNLSIEQKSKQISSLKIIDENNSKFDKYLNQLKDALELFVRQNDLSQLFRRTRILLSKYTNHPSPLHDAINNGHKHIACSLIEQILDISSPNRLLENVDDHGQTPLLIAGKLNEKDIIECILKHRSDLIEQKDNYGNNILHLLANIKDDQSIETIETIFKIIPKNLQLILEEQNHNNQTPLMIAQVNNNEKTLRILTSFLNKK